MATEHYLPFPTSSHGSSEVAATPPLFGLINPLGLLSQSLSTALHGAQTMATNAMKTLVAKSILTQTPMGSAAGKTLAMASKLKRFVDTARFDDPVGGTNIDLFHNRICFDSAVCKHDPEMTNDLNTEWLRRAVYMRDAFLPTKKSFPQTSTQLQLATPHARFQLIPFEDAQKRPNECKTFVHIKDSFDGGNVKVVTAQMILHPFRDGKNTTFNSFL